MPHTKPSPVQSNAALETSDYIDNWDEYWLAIALTAARKSKDPRCRVGAVIVLDNMPLSLGFNGFARDVYDDPILLEDAEEKLRRICHAEQNAIYNAARIGVALKGATIYVTKFPCLACCNAIVQAGIAGMYTHDKKFWDDDPADGDHSRKKSILRQAKIKVEAPFHPEYAPRPVAGLHASSSNDGQPKPVEVPKPPANKPRKRSKNAAAKKRVKPESLSLFPARRPIEGGKS